MQRLVLVLILGFLAWQGYAKYQSSRVVNGSGDSAGGIERSVASPYARKDDGAPPSQFACDGRTYCSQMTSCAEATFFLKNCPGVKMDGNHDGVPCEQQWCK